tara:strand:+ start:577 stop:2148 length:1572 start_codon:yes stop_codon:yes gene_type:complete
MTRSKKHNHSAIDVILYARVSSKEQEREGFSISAQLKLLREYAAREGFVIEHEFVDAETAKSAGRSGFDEMVGFFRDNADTHRLLLVEKTDRLYRNFKDYVTIDELDLDIHLVKEGAVLGPNARSSEKFIHGIKVLMAKNYCDNLSEETKKGMREKARQGGWPGRAPHGYRNAEGTNGKRAIEPDPEFAPIIRGLFEWYATGDHSTREATQKLRDDGLVFRKSKGMLPKSTVHQILRNPFYMGEFNWSGERYQGVHEPLISRDLWQRVQDILTGRFAKRHRKAKHDFAFSRLIECGHCGGGMVGEIKKGKYIYYHCTGYKGKCPEPYTRQEVLEEKFGEVLRGLTFDNDILAWVTQALRESHVDEKQCHNEAIIRLQAEYNRLQNRIETAYEDKLDGRINVAYFDKKSAEWRTEQDRIQRIIKEHESANRTYYDEGVKLLELASRAHELFQKQEPKEKRRLLDFVLSNSSWANGELSVTYRQPFDIIAQAVARNDEEATSKGASLVDTEYWLRQTGSNRRPSD